MSKDTPEYIVVEGPTGVGKTTLAKRLAATFNNDLMLERSSENPFLSKFYEDPESVALPMQLHFLFQRTRLIQTLRQTDMFKPAQVSDFLIQKDKLFAEITLAEDELNLYYQVYNNLIIEAPVPDLIIYLQAPVDVLLRRIYEHGMACERKIDENYLQKISDAYIDFFYHYDDSPLLIINASDFDFANDVSDYNILLEYISDLNSGRHYFNPQNL